jgi:bifunctional oligoribonuclease and PAP phosphatase NrnA
MLNLEEQIIKQIEKSKKPLIVLPDNYLSGAIPAGLALYLLLKKLKKEVKIVCDLKAINNYKQAWSFLPSFGEIKDELTSLRQFIISLDISQAKVNQIKYTVDNNKLNFIISPEDGWFDKKDVSSAPGQFKYDLIIVLDASDLEALGKIYDNHIEFFYKTPIINIDRHPDNEEFGQINYIDLNVVSSAELVYYIFKNFEKNLIDEDIATCLLAGIIADSNNFKTSNLNPRTLMNTSKLIDANGRREEIVNNLYRSRSYEALKLWGKLLNNLRVDGKVAWSYLQVEDFKQSQAKETHLFEIIDELILNLSDNLVFIVAYQTDTDKKANLLLQSIKNINALKITPWLKTEGNRKRAFSSLDHLDINKIKDVIIKPLALELAKSDA